MGFENYFKNFLSFYFLFSYHSVKYSHTDTGFKLIWCNFITDGKVRMREDMINFPLDIFFKRTIIANRKKIKFTEIR